MQRSLAASGLRADELGREAQSLRAALQKASWTSMEDSCKREVDHRAHVVALQDDAQRRLNAATQHGKLAEARLEAEESASQHLRSEVQDLKRECAMEVAQRARMERNASVSELCVYEVRDAVDKKVAAAIEKVRKEHASLVRQQQVQHSEQVAHVVKRDDLAKCLELYAELWRSSAFKHTGWNGQRAAVIARKLVAEGFVAPDSEVLLEPMRRSLGDGVARAVAAELQSEFAHTRQTVSGLLEGSWARHDIALLRRHVQLHEKNGLKCLETV